MSSPSHPHHANNPPSKTARASRAASAHTGAAAPQDESKLENLLFHRGGFSYAFYCMLLSYVEWSGALLSSCARFHAQAPPNKYPRISRPQDYQMEIGLLHAVMGQECKNGTFEHVKRLTIRGARGEFPPVVRPTNVSRPWFPNAQTVSFGRSPFDNIVWEHFPRLHTLDLSHLAVEEMYCPLRGIYNCTCLTNLNVSFSNIDIATIALCLQSSLKVLNVSGCKFHRNDILSLLLRQHKTLTSLDISHCDTIEPEFVEDEFFQFSEILRAAGREPVVVLQELKMNSMNELLMDDADLSCILRTVIRNCPELVTLEMAYNSGAGPLCCAELGRSGIESLLVDNCEDMWEFHTYFRNSRMSKTLKKLVARENDQIRTESIMNFLGCCYQRIGLGCESLVHVDLSDCPNLRSGPLCALAKTNPGLQTFIIRGSNFFVTDVVLSALGKYCSKLAHVDFTGISASDQSVIRLARGCPALEVVKWGRTQTTNHSLQALALYCKGLRHLEVQFRDNQYTERAFILSCKKLETLKLVAPGLSFNPDLILAALAGLPRLVYVKLRGSGFVDITDEACIQFIQDTPTLCFFDLPTRRPQLKDIMSRIEDNDPDQDRNPDSAKYFARARTYKALMQ